MAHGFLQKNTTDEVIQKAQLMMQTALSMRDYTTKQIKPLLKRDQETFIARLFRPTRPPRVSTISAPSTPSTATRRRRSTRLTRATVPPIGKPTSSAFSATIPPPKPVGRAKRSPGPHGIWRSPWLPFRRCLSWSFHRRGGASRHGCHLWQHQRVRVATQRGSGRADRFVPASLPIRMADSAFKNLLTDMGLVALVTLIAVDLALVLIVVRPVSQLSNMADRISKGELDELNSDPWKGRDSRAGRSFDRMRISMSKAMKMLEGE